MNLYDLYQGAKRRLIRSLLRNQFGAIGDRSSFDPVTSRISGYPRIYLGRGVFIGSHASISAGADVVIGDDTVIGPGFTLMTGDHIFDRPGVTYRDTVVGVSEPITIGRNVWIGARVVLLKGVTIGDAAIIGAGTVVTRDVPPFGIAMGVPATVRANRFAGEAREQHQRFIEENLLLPTPGE